MIRKIFLGFLAVAIVCGLAASGYRFGRHLAQDDGSVDSKESAPRVPGR